MNNNSILDVVSILDDYSKDIQEGIEDSAVEVAKKGASTLKKTSPVNKKKTSHKGKYAKGWRTKTEKSFGSQAGFASENKYLSKTEMRFDMVKCPYHDTCVKYGCPEIVKGFCDADDICYGNMHPKISWDRTKTIGYGDDICDFKVHIKEN